VLNKTKKKQNNNKRKEKKIAEKGITQNKGNVSGAFEKSADQ